MYIANELGGGQAVRLAKRPQVVDVGVHVALQVHVANKEVGPQRAFEKRIGVAATLGFKHVGQLVAQLAQVLAGQDGPNQNLGGRL